MNKKLLMFVVRQFAITLIAAGAVSASANGLNSLEVFVKTVKSGKTAFVQTVTAPAKDGPAPRVKTSSGTFEFARPGRFKFVYTKPFAQTIVADGQTLWLYDVDLNQVTARKQSQALGSTPAALIASAPDTKTLEADFTLTDAGDEDGMQWVQAAPKLKDSPLQQVRVGFKQGQMAVLEILDTFGQRSVLTFAAFQANAPMEPGAFQFKPPAGADVIRQ